MSGRKELHRYSNSDSEPEYTEHHMHVCLAGGGMGKRKQEWKGGKLIKCIIKMDKMGMSSYGSDAI